MKLEIQKLNGNYERGKSKMLRYSVYENETLKADFVSEIDAINYKTLLKNINRNCGYKDRYSVKNETFINEARAQSFRFFAELNHIMAMFALRGKATVRLFFLKQSRCNLAHTEKPQDFQQYVPTIEIAMVIWYNVGTTKLYIERG